MTRSRSLVLLLVVASTTSPSIARAEATDEVEVSVLAGMHVRREDVTPDIFTYGQVNAGALGVVELAYRHDFARWSLAGGLRVQYETYVLNGWLGPNDGPNQTFGPPRVRGTTVEIKSFDESAVAIGVPFRMQTAHADAFVWYVLLEPMVVAHSRLLVADYTHFAPDMPSTVDRGVSTRDDLPSFAVYGAVGAGGRVGPGRIVFEIGGRLDTEPTFTAMGQTSALGWSLVAGYRLGVR